MTEQDADRPTPAELVDDFAAYCRANPSQRFWQALRNWSGHNFIFASPSKDDMRLARDTFYWHGRSQ